jgi:hypothetical protein
MGVGVDATLKEEHRLRVLGCWVLRRLSGPKWEEIMVYKNCIMKSFIICYFLPNVIRMIKLWRTI